MLIPAGTKVKLTKDTIGYGNFEMLHKIGIWKNEEEIYAETAYNCNHPDGFACIIFPGGQKYSLGANRLNILNESARPITRGHLLTKMFQINSK